MKRLILVLVSVVAVPMLSSCGLVASQPMNGAAVVGLAHAQQLLARSGCPLRRRVQPAGGPYCYTLPEGARAKVARELGSAAARVFATWLGSSGIDVEVRSIDVQGDSNLLRDDQLLADANSWITRIFKVWRKDETLGSSLAIKRAALSRVHNRRVATAGLDYRTGGYRVHLVFAGRHVVFIECSWDSPDVAGSVARYCNDVLQSLRIAD